MYLFRTRGEAAKNTSTPHTRLRRTIAPFALCSIAMQPIIFSHMLGKNKCKLVFGGVVISLPSLVAPRYHLKRDFVIKRTMLGVGGAVQPSGPRFSRNYRRRKDVRPTGGRRQRRRCQRGFGVGTQGARGTTRIFGGGRGMACGGGFRLLSVACCFLWSFICLSFSLHLLAVSEREASS